MSVRDPSAAATKMAENWPLICALLGGTTAMRKATKAHLPQWPNEDDESYAARLATATLFPAFSRTIEILAGKPFSKPLTLGDDVPSRLKEWAEDIDLQGRNLHAFAGSICQDAISYGLGGVLVDYPTALDAEGNPPRTVADEAALGVRPYMVQINPQNILGWRHTRVNGADVLTQLRLLELVCVPVDDWNDKTIEQVRVLSPGVWQLWRESDKVLADGKKEWVLFKEGTTTLNKVPFHPVYGKRKGFMDSEPPLVELAHSNVKHWQSQSDQDTILHVARVPVLAVVGVDDDKFSLKIGAASAVKLPQGSDIKYVEHTGAAIEAGRMSLLDLQDQMRQAGAELLVIKPGNTTEVQTIADNEQGMCALQRIALDLEDAIDAALQTMAEWVKERQGGHVTVYKDFGAATLAETSAELLLKMNMAGKLSDQSLHSEMQRRGIIAPDTEWDEEKERLDAQGPALGDMTNEPPAPGAQPGQKTPAEDPPKDE